MAQIMQQDNMRGNKRPRYDDYGPVCFDNGPGNTTFITHPTTVDPNLTINSSPDATLSLRNNHSGVNQTTASVPDYSQDAEVDIFSEFLMGDDNILPSSFGGDGAIDCIDLPFGDSSSGGGTGDENHNSWEYVITDGHSSSDRAASSGPLPGQPTEPLQHNSKPRTARVGPAEQEWEERRPLITYLYGPEKPNLNLTLQELMSAMEKAGFLKG